jgi:hypothetical protein
MSDYLEEDNSAFEGFKPHVLTHWTHIESNFKNCFSEQILQQHEYMEVSLQSQSAIKQVTILQIPWNP